MKSTNRVPNAKRPVAFAPAPETGISGRVIEDYDSVQAQRVEEAVELLSICGFVNRVPYRFHMEEIMRFGAKVGAAAEALQLSYLTRVDRSLGSVRVFPMPLMMRVYQVMAAQQGWPQIVDEKPALADASAEAAEEAAQEAAEDLAAAERTEKALDALTARVDNVDVLANIQALLDYLRAEQVRLRELVPAS